MYIVFRNKAMLVSYPTNFTPQILKTYHSNEVIYDSKFYCGRQFAYTGQALSTSAVTIEEGE
jgi:hypothetical protein